MSSAASSPVDQDARAATWKAAGLGWGARALEWAYLFEPYAQPANDLLLRNLGVGEGTDFCDIACGSGLAANTANRRGATVAGLDASEALIRIAQTRTPAGDFHVGDMNALPFTDDCFDVVTSFNGIWKGCEGGLDEARRVLREDGAFGMTFWGSPRRMGLLPYFLKIVELSPPSHQAATMELGDTRRVAEDMLRDASFRILDQGTIDVVAEWPDVATAVRAMAAAGPSIPAIEAVGHDAFCEELHEVIAPLHDPATGVRISSEFGWVTAAPA